MGVCLIFEALFLLHLCHRVAVADCSNSHRSKFFTFLGHWRAVTVEKIREQKKAGGWVFKIGSAVEIENWGHIRRHHSIGYNCILYVGSFVELQLLQILRNIPNLRTQTKENSCGIQSSSWSQKDFKENFVAACWVTIHPSIHRGSNESLLVRGFLYKSKTDIWNDIFSALQFWI